MSRGFQRACLTVLIVVAVGAAFAEEPADAIYRGWSRAVQFDVSPQLRSIPPGPIVPPPANLIDPDSGVIFPIGPLVADPVVQTEVGGTDIPSPAISFDATPNVLGYSPPDPVGEVGPNHYVAMTNVHYSIYSKSGVLLYGPAGNNTLWTGFGGACQTSNDGDPIVLYDQFADRWILTQFTASPPYYNCVAISTSPDPLGTYYRYAFSTGAYFPDYPKYGVWGDAYYISTREFSSTFVGVGAYAVNRQEMIAGNPSPMMISFLAPPTGTGSGQNVGDGLLPSDLDGWTPPPAGSPNFYVGTQDDNRGATQDAINLWRFHADFVTPASSTFTLVHTIPTAAFNSAFPCSPGSRNCIPQPNTTNKVDILSYRRRPMNRLAYRNFGTHESLVTNQSVDAGSGVAGLRWYEIRDPNGAAPFIHQQGTYAPGTVDGIHRWMGSIAMDNGGNMALGYSASDGTSTYPSSWYTGRLVTDSLGEMSQGEGSFINGTGSQTVSDRWGDYTDMTVDPMDDCTFWYVNQYIPVTSGAGWKLRVGAFRFPQCVPTSGLVLFVDGFEDGTTNAWAQTNP